MDDIRPGIFLLLASLFCDLQIRCVIQDHGLCINPANELGNPFIRNYSPAEYGAHPQNWAAVQDDRGVMYFGNNRCVLEFDGRNWNSIAMTNECTVRSLAISKDGTIFVAAVGEFGYLAIDPLGKRFFVSLKSRLKSQDRDFADVWDCFSTSDGVYFFSEKRIFRWHDGRLAVMPVVSGPKNGFKINGRIYGLSLAQGIAVLKGDRWETLLPDIRPILGQTAFFFLPGPDQNKILIVGAEGRFYLFNPNTSSSQTAFEQFTSPLTDYLRKNGIYRVGVVNPNLYWLSTNRGGVVLMDGQGQLVRIINKNRGLQDNQVWNAYVDQTGNIWAMLNYGISYIQINSPLSYFNKLNNLEGIVLSVCRWKGGIYAGNFSGVSCLTDYKVNTGNDQQLFRHIDNTQTHCFDFMKFGGDILLAGGGDGYFQVVGERARLLAQGPGLYCFGYSRLFPDLVFLGTGSGLFALKIRKGGQNFQPAAVQVAAISGGDFAKIHEPIRKIVSDDQGHIWLTTQHKGILYIRFHSLDPSDFALERYTTDDGLPALLWNVVIYANHQLYVATEKGIFKAVQQPDQPTGGKNYRFVLESGLGQRGGKQNMFFTHAFRDRLGNFWLSSVGDFGVLRRDKRGGYTWDDTPFKCFQGGIENFLLEDDGILWLCGVEDQCLFRYDTHFKKNYKSPFYALVSRFSAGKEAILAGINFIDSTVKIGECFTQSTLGQPQQLKIRLSYKNNSLVFHYAAPYFEHADRNRFSCQLAGFEKDWGEWTMESKAVYTNIPEGIYRFKVKAKNVWDHESIAAVLEFSIAPPWQRTWWAYIAYVLLLGLLFTLGIRWNSRRLKLANVRLEKIVADRTAEVVQQKDEIEKYAANLYSTNRQLTEAKNALWGEMELAKKIQTVLLPESPKIPGYEIAACMKPAEEVGGDYYDVINIDVGPRSIGAVQLPKHWIVIGDVSGHGVPAGLVMMMCQTAIHSVLKRHGNDSPEKILGWVNEVIFENIQKLGENKYMTMTIMALQPDGLISFSGLHQDIMICRAATGEVELIETKGMWIGMLDNIEGMVGVDQLQLQAGDCLLLYTDGVTEAKEPDGQMFSSERLQKLFGTLGRQDPESIKNAILSALANCICDDDITMIVLKRQNPGPY